MERVREQRRVAECGGVRVGGQLKGAEQQKNLNKDLEPAAEMLPSECDCVQQKSEAYDRNLGHYAEHGCTRSRWPRI